MSHGVIVINESRRDKLDRLGFTLVRLQFADRVAECQHQQVVLYQSKSTRYSPGYFASATLAESGVYVEDPSRLYVILRDLEPLHQVKPIWADGRIVESYARSDSGILHGRRFSEDVRIIKASEFDELVAGSSFSQDVVHHGNSGMAEVVSVARDRIAREQWARDTRFRSLVLPEYQCRCAITGQKLISGNGLSTGLVVCHGKAVAKGGTDDIWNGVPLCPDFHYRWDHGVIDIQDNYSWAPNGPYQDQLVREWKGPRELFVPENPAHRLSLESLAAHREEVRMRGTRPTSPSAYT